MVWLTVNAITVPGRMKIGEMATIVRIERKTEMMHLRVKEKDIPIFVSIVSKSVVVLFSHRLTNLDITYLSKTCSESSQWV